MLTLVAVSVAVALTSSAEAGEPDYELDKQVIAAGGGKMTRDEFTVTGTIGQVDADTLHPASGGAYEVVGGFWAELTLALPGEPDIFANGFEPPQ